MAAEVSVFVGDALQKYDFPEGHPFSIDRQGAFWNEARKLGLHRRVEVRAPRLATREELLRFHTETHVQDVQALSRVGEGYLDYGDTPAFPGVYEAGASVVGTAVEALDCVMAGMTRLTFQAVGGMHHSQRHCAAGFCVFNDVGVVIDTLRQRYGVRRIGYVDIDVHHGDGVFYPYEADPDLIVVDIHEDGRYLYPGTGHAHETGSGSALGTKLNIPLAPGAGEREFAAAWERAEEHLRRHKPEIMIMQAGADGLAGDPLADLRYTPAVHQRATRSLRRLAEETPDGRMLVFGGGGYELKNIAAAWTAVLQELVAG